MCRIFPLLLCFFAFLSSGTSTVEMDYEDQCDERSTASWEEILGNEKGLSLKLERDKAFGIFTSKQKMDVKSAFTTNAFAADDDVLRRRVKLLLQPGDTLLKTEQWIRLVTFADTALNRLRFATDYDCGVNINCTLRELHNSFAREQDEDTLRRMKASWDSHLPDFTEYLNKIYNVADLSPPPLLLRIPLSGTSTGDDRRWLMSIVDLVEMDYEDQCDEQSTASWEEILGNDKGFSLKLERDKAFGFSSKQKMDVKSAFTPNAFAADDDVLRRRVKLLLQPGDTLLKTEQWIRLVTFADTALNQLRFATDYDCGVNINCTLRELHNSLAREQDEDTLRRMKASWDSHLPDFTEYLNKILPLLRNASKENLYDAEEEYWDSLVEYEGAMLTAREIWDHVSPLYIKLHKYVSLKLKGVDEVGKPLPIHLLRSLTGDDWSNLIESLLPNHPDVYQKLHANMQLKDISGINAFREANNLLNQLNLGELPSNILEESVFNGTCPPTIVDWCRPNKMRFVSCKDVSIQNYMDAHETAMKIKYKIMTALHSNNTYVLREAPRYSAIYEAVPGFMSLLSLNPHTLDRTGLYPLNRFNYNPNHNRLVLQLIIALRDLPKLNYYLAADKWQLDVLMGKIPYPKIMESWSELRKSFSLIETSNADILGNSYVLSNKPYIGKFLGVILKYQIYQSFAEELVSDDSDLVKHISENNQRLIDTMMQGYGSSWPEMVSDLLAKRENGLEYTGLTDYFRLLDEYLDSQLDPTNENTIEEYVEPPVEVPLQENEIPDDITLSKEKYNEEEEEKSIIINMHENIIETEDEHYSKLETSTVGVLEIKPKRDQKESENIKEASYTVYWWIGVAVAIAIVVILVALIARKRHSHRKQLERQRRQNTRA